MALICDKCKEEKIVKKDFRGTGKDLCEECSVLFDDLMEKTINEFTQAKKQKKNLLKDIGKIIYGPKK